MLSRRLLVVLPLLPAAFAAEPAKPTRDATFTKDVAPILQRACQNCHRPGAIAPMSLVSYDDVRPWARAMLLSDSHEPTIFSMGCRARAARIMLANSMPEWILPLMIR